MSSQQSTSINQQPQQEETKQNDIEQPLIQKEVPELTEKEKKKLEELNKKQYQTRIRKYLCLVNIIISILVIGTGCYQYYLISHFNIKITAKNLRIIYQPFYLIFFGLILFLQEIGFKIISKIFPFLNTYVGIGLFNIFLASNIGKIDRMQTDAQQNWQIGVGYSLFVIGIIYMFIFCFIKDSETHKERVERLKKKEEDAKKQAQLDEEVTLLKQKHAEQNQRLVVPSSRTLNALVQPQRTPSQIAEMTLQKLQFSTKHLTITALTSESPNIDTISRETAKILTPQVKLHLPPDIQSVNDAESANKWLIGMIQDSFFLTVKTLDTDTLIGFFLLYEEKEESGKSALRLGYVVGEFAQGKGYASEMIGGLVAWCSDSLFVSSLTGGVEVNNLASARVLEKNGFVQESQDEQNIVFCIKFSDLKEINNDNQREQGQNQQQQTEKTAENVSNQNQPQQQNIDMPKEIQTKQ